MFRNRSRWQFTVSYSICTFQKVPHIQHPAGPERSPCWCSQAPKNMRGVININKFRASREIDPVRGRNSLKKPLFRRFFAYLRAQRHRPAPKVVCKKKCRRTNRENLARSGGRRDPVLDLRNGSPLASSLQKCRQNKLADSLNH